MDNADVAKLAYDTFQQLYSELTPGERAEVDRHIDEAEAIMGAEFTDAELAPLRAILKRGAH